MAANNSHYQKIIEICYKSQDILNKRVKEIGDVEAIAEFDKYESMWEKYSKGIKKPIELKQKNFSGLLFKNARLKKHNFIDCDFSGSRWVFSNLEGCNCTGSNFSNITALLMPFKDTNCTNCDFTNAELNPFEPFKKNNFENSNFTNAKLETSHSFFKEEKHSPQANFKNAIMEGCRLTIKKEQHTQHNVSKARIKSIINKLFSSEQLAVMRINYGDGCFIATAACGLNSKEVTILRHFRDTVLLNSYLGRLFVRSYNRFSPPIASLIQNSPKTCDLIRNLLIRPITKFVIKKYSA